MSNLPSKEESLLPCPFCGEMPKSHSYSIGGKSYAWIRCERCNIGKELHTDGMELSLQMIAMGGVEHWWNQRALSGDSSQVETGCYPEYTNAIGDAGYRYMQSCGVTIWSGAFYWHKLWDVLNAAARQSDSPEETTDE